MTLPASQYSVLDAKKIERLDDQTFVCHVGGLKFFNFEVEPVITVSVTVQERGPTVRLLSCKVCQVPCRSVLLAHSSPSRCCSGCLASQLLHGELARSAERLVGSSLICWLLCSSHLCWLMSRTTDCVGQVFYPIQYGAGQPRPYAA
jgi:hypothetical protein